MTKAPYIVYTPDEDFVLTKEDVNSGGGGGGSSDTGVFIVNTVNISEYDYRLDKTWQEIFNATASGKICIISHGNSDESYTFLEIIVVAEKDSVECKVKSLYHTTGTSIEFNTYKTDTPDEYPVWVNPF